MTHLLIVSAGGAAEGRSDARMADAARNAFLQDTFALAGRLRNLNPLVCHPAELRPTLARTLVTGPTIVLTGQTPHLPIWRLRDALTLLERADLVIGAGEQGEWYLIGMRAAHPELLRAFPDLDESCAGLIACARETHLQIAALAPWFRVDTPADLDRLLDAVRIMPADVAPHTRALFAEDGLYTIALGG